MPSPPTTRPTRPPQPSPGLAQVIRRISDVPQIFDGIDVARLDFIEDLPIGQTVLVLPEIPDDVGWTAVLTIVDSQDWLPFVHQTWVHPQCVKSVEGNLISKCPLTVGHCQNRNEKKASHPELLLRNKHARAGPWLYEQKLYLDCRWKDKRSGDYSDVKHSGHCLAVCLSVAAERQRVADILQFAHLLVDAPGNAAVVCSHGKHRSVAAANILKLLFRFPVDFQEVWSLEKAAKCRICNDFMK